MWRLWNSVSKGFRSTAARGCRENIGTDPEQTGLLPVRPNIAPLQSSANSRSETYRTSQTCTSNRLRDYTFAEAVGLGSALAVGWHICHERRKQLGYSVTSNSTLLDTVLRIAFAQPDRRSVKQNVAAEQKPKLCSHSNKTTLPSETEIKADIGNSGGKNTQSQSKSLLPEMLDTAAEDLMCGESIIMGDLQNQAGVQLMLASQQGGKLGDPELDGFFPSGNASACRREAFLCFREASKLGNVKGKFNLGLCYEQGIGTPVNLSKAATYYEEASNEGHAGAQYNLGLLHFGGYIPGKSLNKGRAIELWRQSAKGGLEEAWTALLSVLNTQPVSTGQGSSTSLNILDDISAGLEHSNGSPQTFKKSRSEPYNLSGIENAGLISPSLVINR